MPLKISPSLRRRVIDAALAAERDPSVDLSVSSMAEYAGISDKHFQRCFRQLMGESPKSYVRRIRLQSAAYLLKWSDVPVTNIAFDAGFDTHAGFTKAFQKLYAQSPQQFRQARNVAPYLHSREVSFNEAGVADEAGVTELEASRLVVRVEQNPDWRIACMRHVGPVEKTADVWPKMIQWAKRREVLTPKSTLLGIHNDYWDSNAEDKYRYDAAIVIPDDFVPDEEISLSIIRGGPVAMTEFSGSITQADQTWRRFVDQWLPISGYQFREGFAFDRYPYELLSGGMIRNIIRTLTGIRATLCIPISKTSR